MVDIDNITNNLKEKYPELGIAKLDIDESKGTSTFYMRPTKSLPFITENGGGITPRREVAATIKRSPIDRSYLDLATKTSPYNANPKDLFTTAMTYYKENPLVGSAINTMVFLSAKGFENDIDDEEIKKFFDVWCHDVRFQEVLEWIYTDLIKVGHVFTYKTTAPYTKRESKISPVPGVALSKLDGQRINNIAEDIFNSIINKATSYGIEGAALKELTEIAAKQTKKATQIPVAYTVLNPLTVEIEGSMFFGSTSVVMTAPDDLKALLKKAKKDLSDKEKELLNLLPKEFTKEIVDSGKVTLDNELVGQITYMKQPYERYASPRLTRAFDSLEYKRALVNADLSTLDGISNYILKITIGNDEFPVTSDKELETVAKLFNTTSKSFDVVWNHTLKIEKIVSPEIDAILGKGKYEQVEDDISAGIAVIRSLIDGKGTVNSSQLSLLLKGLAEEINYIRGLVTRWIYDEYAKIAEIVGFDRFPRIRWDDSILKDTILYMTVISQLVDRRMLSYQTAHETLGFDYATELNNMTNELPLVKDGTFGLKGSPWQQNKGIQPTQEAPTGTPSSGRPLAKPTKTKNTPKIDDSKAALELVKDMTKKEFSNFILELIDFRKED